MNLRSGTSGWTNRTDDTGQHRRRPWLVALGGLALLVALVGGLAAYRLARVASELRSARTLIDTAGTDLEAGRLGPARQNLDRAQTLLTAANGRLYTSPEIDLVAWVPGVRQNLDALRQSVGVALRLVDGGGRILDAAGPLEGPDGDLEVPLADGAIPLDAVRASGRESEALAIALPTGADRVESGLVLPQITDVQDRVFAEAERRRVQLTNVARALSLITEMSGGNGDRRYLIAVANTAEQRGSGGMILSYGELTSSQGDFELGEFGNVDEIELDAPVDTPLPDDYLERWDGFDPEQRWRNANLGADLTVVAPAMEAMFTEATGKPTDGVIQIDPAGLAAILEGTGPVRVPTVGEVTADNVVDLTLNSAYVLFPDRDVRQEVLGDVAEAVFDRLLDGEYESLRPLGEALAEAVAERHLLVHSSRPTAQREIEFFDADGALPPAETIDWLHLTSQNVSANKLDYYLDTSLAVKGTRRPGKAGMVEATVTLANTAPDDGSPRYIFGPNDRDETAGLYRGLVTLYLPTGAQLLGASGDPTQTRPAFDTEAGRSLVTFRIDVPAGDSRTVTLRLRLPPRPPGSYRAVLVPQPRVRPTKVALDLDLGDARLRRTLTLPRSYQVGEGGRIRTISGPGRAGNP